MVVVTAVPELRGALAGIGRELVDRYTTTPP
jgi:hypothetical protein